MDKDASWRTIDQHRVVVADLLAGLPDEAWTTRSLCEGWSVRDVGAHLSMAATSSIGEVWPWVVRSRGNFDRMIRDSAIDRARRPTAQIVDDLRGIVGSRRLAPGTLWRDPLLDVIVHAHDIARPLGIAVQVDPEAARTAADWAWMRVYPFFPGRRLRGLRLVADDIAWSRGRGLELRGPVESLLLVSTGRRRRPRRTRAGRGSSLLGSGSGPQSSVASGPRRWPGRHANRGAYASIRHDAPRDGWAVSSQARAKSVLWVYGVWPGTSPFQKVLAGA